MEGRRRSRYKATKPNKSNIPSTPKGEGFKRNQKLHGLVAVPALFVVEKLGRPLLYTPRWRRIKGICLRNMVWIPALVKDVNGNNMKLYLIATPSLTVTITSGECELQPLSDDFLEALEPSSGNSPEQQSISLPPMQMLNEASILLHFEAQFAYRQPFVELSESSLAWINDNTEQSDGFISRSLYSYKFAEINTQGSSSNKSKETTLQNVQGDLARRYFQAARRSELSIEQLPPHPFKLLARSFRSAIRTDARQFIAFQGYPNSGKSRLMKQAIVFYSSLRTETGRSSMAFSKMLPKLHTVLTCFSEYLNSSGKLSSSAAIQCSLSLRESGDLHSASYSVKRLVALPRSSKSKPLILSVWSSWVLDAIKCSNIPKLVPGIPASIAARAELYLRDVSCPSQQTCLGTDLKEVIGHLVEFGLVQSHILTVVKLTMAAILLFVTGTNESAPEDTSGWTTVSSLLGVSPECFSGITAASDEQDNIDGKSNRLVKELATSIDGAILSYVVRLVNYTLHERATALCDEKAAAKDERMRSIASFDLVDTPGVNANQDNKVEKLDVFLSNYLRHFIDSTLEAVRQRSVKYVSGGSLDGQKKNSTYSTSLLSVFTGIHRPFGILSDLNNRGMSTVIHAASTKASFIELCRKCEQQERIFSRNIRDISRQPATQPVVRLQKRLPPKDTEIISIMHPGRRIDYKTTGMLLDETIRYVALGMMEKLATSSVLPHCGSIVQGLNTDGVWAHHLSTNKKPRSICNTVIGSELLVNNFADGLATLQNDEMCKLCQLSSPVLKIANDIQECMHSATSENNPLKQPERGVMYGRPWSITCFQSSPNGIGGEFDAAYVNTQLQGFPVLQEIMIGRSALENACDIEEFYIKFCSLSSSTLSVYGVLPPPERMNDACAHLLKELLNNNEALRLNLHSAKKQFYVSKSTLYVGTTLLELLEGLRSLSIRKVENAAKTIQRFARKNLAEVERGRYVAEILEKNRRREEHLRRREHQHLYSLSRTLYFNLRMLLQRKAFLATKKKIVRIQGWWRHASQIGCSSTRLLEVNFWGQIQGFIGRKQMALELREARRIAYWVLQNYRRKFVKPYKTRFCRKIEGFYISCKTREIHADNLHNVKALSNRRMFIRTVRRLVALVKSRLVRRAFVKFRRTTIVVQRWFRERIRHYASSRITRFMKLHFGFSLTRSLQMKRARKINKRVSLLNILMEKLLQKHCIQSLSKPISSELGSTWHRQIYSVGKIKTLTHRKAIVIYSKLFRDWRVGRRRLKAVQSLIESTESARSSPIVDLASSDSTLLALRADGTLNMISCIFGNRTKRDAFSESINGTFSERTVISIAAGRDHYLFATSHGKAFTVGNNLDGCLGLGPSIESSLCPRVVEHLNSSIDKVAAGTYHSLFLSKKGKLFACGRSMLCGMVERHRGRIQWYPVEVPGMQLCKIEYISSGFYHSVAMEQDGKLWSFGSNRQGQLGTRECSTPYEMPTRIHLPFQHSKSVLYAARVSAGPYHTACVTHEGKAFAWGWRRDTQVRYLPHLIRSPTYRVVDVAAVLGRTILLLEDGSLRYDNSLEDDDFDVTNEYLKGAYIVPKELFRATSRGGSLTILGVNLYSTDK